MKRFEVFVSLVIFAMIFITGNAFAGTATIPEGSGIVSLIIMLGGMAGVGLAMSADSQRDEVLGDINQFPVLLSTTVYKGAAVGLSVGYARGLVAGDRFMGIALEKADNASGGSGDINVKVLRRGCVVLAVTSIAITDIGKAVYASADGTFTLTPGSNSYIGTAVRFISTGYADVAFDTMMYPAGFNNNILACGIHTSTAATANDVTIAGVAATDVVVATLHTVGNTPRTITSAVTATGKITITFSGDPSTDHKVNYVVIRPSA